MLIAAVKNTQGNLSALVKGDFTGQNNFIYWIAAIMIIGALGYVPKVKPFSVALLGLVILVLFLTKGNPAGVGGGFFAQLTKGLATTQTPQPNASSTPLGNTGALNLPGFAGVASQLIH